MILLNVNFIWRNNTRQSNSHHLVEEKPIGIFSFGIKKKNSAEKKFAVLSLKFIALGT